MPRAFSPSLFLMTAACASVDPEPRRSTQPGEWVIDSIVPGDSLNLAFESVSIAARDGILYVVGLSLPAVADVEQFRDTMPSKPFTAVRLRLSDGSRSRLPVPADAGPIQFPLLYVTPDSTLHMVWGDTAVRPGRFSPGSANLRYSRFQHGVWSPSTVILSAESIEWRRETQAGVLEINGEGHFVVVLADQATRRLAIIGIGKAGATVTRIPYELVGLERSPTLVASRDEILGIAFIAYETGSGAGVSFMRTSNNGGRWDAPTRVPGSVGQSPGGLRALAGKGGETHLLWRQGRAALRHAISPDGGSSWPTAVATLPVPDISNPRVVGAACGNLYLTFNAMREDGASNFLMRWASGAWTPVTLPGAAQLEQEADLVADSQGILHRVWTAVSVREGRHLRAVTLHAALDTRQEDRSCSRTPR